MDSPALFSLQTKMKHKLLVFVFLVAVCSAADLPSGMVTTDVKLTASPAAVIDGLTRCLAVNCTFAPENGSDFTSVISLILSKASYNSNNFNEIASITLHSNDQVHVKNTSLGVKVTGHLPPITGNAFLALEWDHPGEETTGQYQCQAFGIEYDGHPRISTASITVTLEDLSAPMCMAQLRNLTLEHEYLLTDLNVKTEKLSNLNKVKSEELSNLTKLHTEELSNLNKVHTAELSNLTQTYTEELSNLTQAHTNQVSSLTQTYTKQLANLNLTYTEKTNTQAEEIKNLTKQNGDLSATLKTQTDQNKNLTKEMEDLLRKTNDFLTSYLIVASSSFQGHRYILTEPIERNITKSDLLCQTYGGYLVEINDRPEYDFVYNFVITQNNVNFFVIGATDASHDGTWTFIHSGQPAYIVNKTYGTGNCLEIWRVNNGMVEQPCFATNVLGNIHILCEIPN